MSTKKIVEEALTGALSEIEATGEAEGVFFGKDYEIITKIKKAIEDLDTLIDSQEFMEKLKEMRKTPLPPEHYDCNRVRGYNQAIDKVFKELKGDEI